MLGGFLGDEKLFAGNLFPHGKVARTVRFSHGATNQRPGHGLAEGFDYDGLGDRGNRLVGLPLGFVGVLIPEKVRRESTVRSG